MKELGFRIDFHTHTNLSDGYLLPAALIREAEVKGISSLGITDHIDHSNVDFVINSLKNLEKEMKGKTPVKFFIGGEVSYVPPKLMKDFIKKARELGAKLIIVHGESPVESVYEGTNHEAVLEKGLVDILAHPGNITKEDVSLAQKNGIFLELSARNGHKNGNEHVFKLAKELGAKLLLNTDSHTEKDLITQEEAVEILKKLGADSQDIYKILKENPEELVRRIESR